MGRPVLLLRGLVDLGTHAILNGLNEQVDDRDGDGVVWRAVQDLKLEGGSRAKCEAAGCLTI